MRSIELIKKPFLILCFLFTSITSQAQAKWVKIELGSFSSVAIRSDGTLWSWGFNANGQLGLGDFISRNTPVQVGLDTNWIDVSSGAFHTMALKSDGTIWTWGLNGNGQLGFGNTIQRSSPFQVGLDTNWKSISAGQAHSMGIKTDSSLWAWGLNFDGQIGNGTTTDRFFPIQVGSSHDWLIVSAGGGHTMAIKVDGTLFGWGNDGNGQLGHGTNLNRTTPAQIGTDTNWADVSSGLLFSAGMKKDSSLWAWGDNNVGQVGNGLLGNTNVPVSIGNVNSTWIKVSSGTAHSFAIRSDSALFGWGLNQFGQLGTGNTTTQRTPVQIGSSNDWIFIGAPTGSISGGSVSGGFHSLGIRASSNSICAVGWNTGGQLGNSSTSNRSTFSCNTGVIVGIWENSVKKDAQVQIYPNPTSGMITVSINDEISPTELTLKNIQGRTISTLYFTNNQLHTNIEGPAGMYFLELKYKDGSVLTKKLIKTDN